MSSKSFKLKNKKSKKIQVKEWTSSRPKPQLDISYWPEDEVEELVDYMDWHGRHPHCTSPRLCLDEEKRAIATNYVDESNPQMIYSKIPYKSKPLTQEYLPSRIGIEGNMDEVSVIATNNEWNQHYGSDFEDPWYNMSVRDTIELSHVNDNETIHSKTKSTSSLSSYSTVRTKELPNWAVARHKGYEGGSPWDLYKQTNVINKISKADKTKAVIIQSNDKVSIKQSKFTEKGTALNEFNKDMLDKKLDEVLTIYNEKEVKDNKDLYDDYISSHEIDDDIDEQQQSIITTLYNKLFLKNRKVIEKNNFSTEELSENNIPESVDKYDKMLKHLGGNRKTMTIAKKFINYSNYIRDMTVKRSYNDRQLNFIDSCVRLLVNNVKTYLLRHGLPDICMYDDMPLFYYLIDKLIKFDVASNSLVDNTNESIDRKKTQTILDLLISYRININDICESTGYSPVHLIAINNDTKVMKWLLKYKPILTIPSIYDKLTAIQYAAKYGHMLIILALYRNNYSTIRLDDTDRNGRTILHIAAMYGQTTICYYLLKLGCSKNIADKNNKLPHELAKENHYNITSDTITTYNLHNYPTNELLEYFIDKHNNKTNNNKRTKKKKIKSNKKIKDKQTYSDMYNQLVDYITSLFIVNKKPIMSMDFNDSKDDDDDSESVDSKSTNHDK